MKIKKIWSDSEHIFGCDETGCKYNQLLLWYPKLLAASVAKRNQYTFGYDGIHWRQLDEDISFESFAYEDSEPTPLQRFFLTQGNQCGIVCTLTWDERHTTSQLYQWFQETISRT